MTLDQVRHPPCLAVFPEKIETLTQAGHPGNASLADEHGCVIPSAREALGKGRVGGNAIVEIIPFDHESIGNIASVLRRIESGEEVHVRRCRPKGIRISPGKGDGVLFQRCQ